MTDPQQDAGLLSVLIERLESQRLPRALELKNKVDRGETIDEFLQEILSDAAYLKPLIERHPEHQELVGKLFGLYRDISEKALANEKAG